MPGPGIYRQGPGITGSLRGLSAYPARESPVRRRRPILVGPRSAATRRSQAFENLRLAVADGFTDFTRTQHEILELLAGWVDEIFISLPLEPEPRRSDLFSKPLKTLSELERRHGNLSVKELPRPENPPWPAMNHLEKTCLSIPAAFSPAPGHPKASKSYPPQNLKAKWNLWEQELNGF